MPNGSIGHWISSTWLEGSFADFANPPRSLRSLSLVLTAKHAKQRRQECEGESPDLKLSTTDSSVVPKETTQFARRVSEE